MQLGNDRHGCSTAAMLSRESVDLEQRLAKLIGADPADVRTYLCEVIEERLWGRSPKERKTGLQIRSRDPWRGVRPGSGGQRHAAGGLRGPRGRRAWSPSGLAHDDVAEGLVGRSQRVLAERDP